MVNKERASYRTITRRVGKGCHAEIFRLVMYVYLPVTQRSGFYLGIFLNYWFFIQDPG